MDEKKQEEFDSFCKYVVSLLIPHLMESLQHSFDNLLKDEIAATEKIEVILLEKELASCNTEFNQKKNMRNDNEIKTDSVKKGGKCCRKKEKKDKTEVREKVKEQRLEEMEQQEEPRM